MHEMMPTLEFQVSAGLVSGLAKCNHPWCENQREVQQVKPVKAEPAKSSEGNTDHGEYTTKP